MAKLNWEISRAEYGVQCEVIANTRSGAIAIAEQEYLKQTEWEMEVIGQLADDGTVIVRSPIPTYTAKKIGRKRV